MIWLWMILGGTVAFLALILSPWWAGRLVLPGFTLPVIKHILKPLAVILGRISPGLELKLLVKAGNRRFRREFAQTPFEERLLFLPFCLRPLDCPAPVDRDSGLICQGQCPGCPVGEARNHALELGYQAVYVVPSSRMMRGRGLLPSDQFIKGKLMEHKPGAALGVVCAWHLQNRLMERFSVRGHGYAPPGSPRAAALQGVLLKARSCAQAQVDWAALRGLMHLKESPVS